MESVRSWRSPTRLGTSTRRGCCSRSCPRRLRLQQVIGHEREGKGVTRASERERERERKRKEPATYTAVALLTAAVLTLLSLRYLSSPRPELPRRSS